MRNPNENRPGFKKTEAGWIPMNWDVMLVDQLCSFSSGNGFRPSDWSSEGLPIIRIQNLNGSQEFNYFAGKPKVEWLVFPGDLLFAWAGVRGVSFGPKIWRGPKAVLNQHIYKLHPLREVDVNWLFLTMLRVTAAVERKAHGFKSSLLHVHKKAITGQHVPFPPFWEQKTIGEMFSAWDAASEQTRHLIHAKKRRRAGLLQQILTGTRRLRAFKEPWTERLLGDIFDERDETNCQHLQLLAITANRGLIRAAEIERKDSSSEDKSKYKRIAPGDIGYNTMRMWQGVSAVSDLEGIVSPAYTICVPKERVDVRFMGYLFKFPPVVHSFWRHSQGLVDDTLSLKFHNFAQVKVRIPSVDEQHHIAEVIRAADEEIKVLEQKLIALEKQKQGLMQKLLTGEVRGRV